ncbi:MAG: popeye domain-containing protein [Parachlamydia sp.]|jgi:hypothetical protein|nr:popeye domain-containing protein [Parachlamydia sp.]
MVLTGELATATDTAVLPSRYIYWKQDVLRKLSDSDFDIFMGVQLTINKDLMRKLSFQTS